VSPTRAWESTQVSEITAQAVTAAKAPADGQRQALERAKREFQRDPNDANRLRLAAMLATLPDPLRDDMRATVLLKPLAAHDAESPYCSLALLLTAEVAERRRMAQQSEKALKDAEKAIRDGQAREEALQKRLEALRSIEHGIIRREEAVRQPEMKP
jgi:hypothetical protein